MRQRLILIGLLGVLATVQPAQAETLTRRYELASQVAVRTPAPAGTTSDGSIDVGTVVFPPSGGTGTQVVTVTVKDDVWPLGVEFSVCQTPTTLRCNVASVSVTCRTSSQFTLNRAWEVVVHVRGPVGVCTADSDVAPVPSPMAGTTGTVTIERT